MIPIPSKWTWRFFVLASSIVVCAKSFGVTQKNVPFKDFEPAPSSRTIYVSGTGRDSNNGKTIDHALRTLQKAADTAAPGDTILVLNGDYTTSGPGSTVLYITRSGTANSWIRFVAHPGHHPRIQVQDNWGGITIAGASYIVIDGFEIKGNRRNITLKYALEQAENLHNPTTSGNGISLTNLKSQISHHVIIRNCHVYDCCGGGIATEHADYVRIENNLVHHNAFYSPYSQSGISLYLNANHDDLAVFRIVVRNNTCSSNENLVPSYYSAATANQRTINDGNGIIIDDTRNIQNDESTIPFSGYTLIEGNNLYDNGGRGILAYLSDRVYISRNNCQNNARSGTINSDVAVKKCSSIYLVHNNIQPRIGKEDLEIADSDQVFVYE